MLFINEYGHLINNNYMEINEQLLAQKYIQEDDRVLELGARYGTVSCMINSKLKGKFKKLQVSVEPDERVWDALEKNKLSNKCEFNIVKGFISNKKLELTNLDECYGGYGATSIENEESKIPIFKLHEIQRYCYVKSFNVLVADCEGFLGTFLEENPDIIERLRLVIFEADYEDKCDYNKIHKLFTDEGFKCELKGHQNVYIR